MRNPLSLLLTLLLILPLFTRAQSSMEVKIAPQIDSLIQKRIQLYGIANTLNTNKTISKGYRLQIFYGSDRREVFAQQSKFISLYPEIGTYLSYKQPNYYLKVGDFRTRAEAQSLLSELKSTFATLFISYEKINPSKVKPIPSNNEPNP